MKRIKKNNNLLLPNFYFKLDTHQLSQSILLNLFHKRLTILRMVEVNACDLSLVDLTDEEDVLSHFVMRMVCFQIEWVYKWFVEVESKFFRLKLGNIENLEGYFKEIVLNYRGLEVIEEELRITRESYIDYYDKEEEIVYANGVHANGVYANRVYKTILVHFSKMVSVFSKRLVEFKGGYCELSHIDTLLVNEFKGRLRRWGCPKEDSRLMNICKDVFLNRKVDTPLVFSSTDTKYYPFCILSILDNLKKGHLKYNDRQALSLFLKECGMSVEECATFISSKFNIPRADFDRLYLYNIRHNYGLEGKKADYSCYSCQKMAYNKNSNNLSGCPFVDNKKQVEEYLNGSFIDIEDIFKEKNPTSRCTKVLEKLTKEKYKKVVTTPIKYFVTYKENKERG